MPFTHEAKGDYELAIAEFEQGGDNAGVRGHLGRSYIKAGRLTDGRRIVSG